MKFLLITISIFIVQFISSTNSEKIQSGFLNQKFISSKKQTDYGGHYTVYELKCDWDGFLMYLKDNANFTVNRNDVYEIEFLKVKSGSLVKLDVQEIKKNLFEKFKIRKLILSNLKLEKIHPGAFKGCCEETLEYLDLSNNNLKRIDEDVLADLGVIKTLNLAANPNLQFSSENFKNNGHLRNLNLSSNNLEYLPEKVFSNLTHLENVDVSNNNLRNLDACTFYPIYSDLKEKEHLKAKLNVSFVHVNALNNNIECDCSVFFLEKGVNIKLNLVCGGYEPEYYIGKHIDNLNKEDPNNVNCFYKDIEFNCKSKYENANELLKGFQMNKILVIVFATLFSLFFLLFLCACCQVCKLGRKLKESRESNHQLKKPKKARSSTHTEYKELKQATTD